MSKKYCRINTVVDAVKFTGDFEEVENFVGVNFQPVLGSPVQVLVYDEFTLTVLTVNEDDYIIRDHDNGGYFVLEGSYFERFFEVVE